MRRFSLFALVVLLPLIVAVGFAARRHHVATRQTQSLTMFDRAIENGHTLPFSRMIKDFGRSEAAKHIERAAESELITFDGDTRIAHIRKEGLTYTDGSLDLLLLYDFTGRNRTAIQQPPVGTVIDSVVFVGNGVDISLHGDLLVNGSRIFIPSGKPEVYHLKWIRGNPPAGPPLQTLIERRQRP